MACFKLVSLPVGVTQCLTSWNGFLRWFEILAITLLSRVRVMVQMVKPRQELLMKCNSSFDLIDS